MEFQVSGDGEWGEVQFIDLNRGRIREDSELEGASAGFFEDAAAFSVP